MVLIIPRLLRAARNFIPTPKPMGSRSKATFELVFDESGRYLMMHNNGALKYYKMNVAFLCLFAGVSFYNYVQNA